MTVTSTSIIAGPYNGNDVADEFSYGFRIEDKTQISVYETVGAAAPVLLTVDVDYTVAGIGVDAGGDVTRVAGPLPTGSTWFMRSNYPETQLTEFDSQGGFFPDTHEDSFDKLTFLTQQLVDKVGRALRLPLSYFGSASTEIPLPEANRGLKWNATGDALVNTDADPDESANAAAASAAAALVSENAAAADLVLTNADVVSTNADVVSTNADVVLTNADVVTTGGNVTLSANWAQKTDGFVSGSDNSSKSWAIGGTGDGEPTGGSSKKWATEAEDVVVSGGLFSAFHWAQKAAAASGGDTVKVSANDTTAAELVSKITGGTGVTVTEVGDGGNETLNINIDSTVTTLTGSQTLTNKTLTSPIINTPNFGNKVWTTIAELNDTDSTTGLITGLDGDSDQFYRLFVYAVTTVNTSLGLRFNGDTGSNYTFARALSNAGTPTEAYLGSTATSSMLIAANGGVDGAYTVIDIHAQSGHRRVAFCHSVVDSGSGIIIEQGGGSWTNTVDNITSIQARLGSGSYTTGTRIILQALR